MEMYFTTPNNVQLIILVNKVIQHICIKVREVYIGEKRSILRKIDMKSISYLV